MEIVGVRDVDAVPVSKKSFRVSGPVRVGQICKVDGNWISGLSGFDVRVKLLNVHDGDSLEDRDIERGCSKGQYQLLISKNWMEIVRIYSGIVAASLLRVDARAETDDEVEV